MNHVSSRLQRQYAWTPAFRTAFKKEAPERNLVTVPQTTGRSGWIVFTYENNIPVCVWITSQECLKIPCCVDERICNDTFLRVEKTGPLEFVVADIWMYNSNCVFACSSFQQRYEWLQAWMKLCLPYVQGTAKFIHKADLTNYKIRGYEMYTDDIGGKGFYKDDDGIAKVSVKKMSLPDCYEVAGGYLRVPDLKTSKFLRTLGDEFSLACKKEEDGSWSLCEKVLD